MQRLLSLLHSRRNLLLAQLFVGLPLMFGLCVGLAALASLLVDWGALVVYLFLMFRILWALVRARGLESQFGFLSSGWQDLKGSIVLVFSSYVLFYTLFFALACRELYSVFGLGFTLDGAEGVWPWLGFGLDNLLEIILLDVPEIYGLALSPIQAESFAAASAVLAFRLSLDVVLIKWVLECLTLVLWQRSDVNLLEEIRTLVWPRKQDQGEAGS